MEREDVDGERARALVAWLELHAGSTCARCDRPVCRHELLFASALGFRAPPWCSSCAAREIGQTDAGALRRHLRAHFARRSCFAAAWSFANASEPTCTLCATPASALDANVEAAGPPLADSEWDAGDLGCGDLVLELRDRLRALEPGDVLKLVAFDPGAPLDLPAWCVMTGHALVFHSHPHYFIRRKRSG
jgi:tRNA 2-thiouridine synthesizing protein A